MIQQWKSHQCLEEMWNSCPNSKRPKYTYSLSLLKFFLIDLISIEHCKLSEYEHQQFYR